MATKSKQDMQEVTMFRKHFNSGQNINMYSLDADHTFIHDFLREELYEDDVVSKIVVSDEWQKPLQEYIYANYKNLCTERQIEYLEKTREEQIEDYSRQLRYKYRTTIRRRMSIAITGYDMQYYNKLNPQLVMLRHIKKMEKLTDDNEQFSKYLLDNIDEPYISKMIYERLSCKSRESLVFNRYNPRAVSSKALYEVYRLLQYDKGCIRIKFKEQAGVYDD